MRAILTLVAIAIVLTFVGGVGWVACRVAEADGVRQVFQWMLVVAMVVTFVSLATALIVGLWHLYLYFFTRKKPVSLFASTPREGERN